MNRKKKTLLRNLQKLSAVACLLVIFLFSQPIISKAESTTPLMPPTAAFYLLPDYSLFFDPDYLYIDIIVDPAAVAINAAEIKLNFDTAYLNLEEVSYSESFCEFLLATTTNNTLGTFSMACGTTQSNFNFPFTLTRLKFSKIQAGWVNLLLSNSAMLSNDGTGSKITTTEEIHNIMIIK